MKWTLTIFVILRGISCSGEHKGTNRNDDIDIDTDTDEDIDTDANTDNDVILPRCTDVCVSDVEKCSEIYGKQIHADCGGQVCCRVDPFGADADSDADADTDTDADADADTDTDADSDTDSDDNLCEGPNKGCTYSQEQNELCIKAGGTVELNENCVCCVMPPDTDTAPELECSRLNEWCVSAISEIEHCFEVGGILRAAPNCDCCTMATDE